MTFQELGLSPELEKIINQLGYTTPTPIQEQAIPAILQGRDILACAETGTGKTGAFLLPTVEILQTSRSRQGLPSAIVMVPTRELATQVLDNFNAYATVTGTTRTLKAISVVGGEVISSQERQLKKGVDMIIATPGRLLDLLERGKIICTNIKMVILDEADRMLDMGFMADVDRILSSLPKLRQTLLFSATVADEVKKISQLYQMNPKEIKISRSAKTSDLIDQRIVHVTEPQKQPFLYQLLTTHTSSEPEKKPIIIFCNRKKDINGLARFLTKSGFTADYLHGDMNQHSRNETLEKFRQEQFQILVTSDVAARGLDITGIGLVVNYNVPINVEDYVHRIGRTGRAGQAGLAIMFVQKTETKRLKSIEKLIKAVIPEMTIVVEEKHPIVEKSSPKPPQREESSSRTAQREESSPRKDVRRSTSDRNNRYRNQEFSYMESENTDGVIGFGTELPAFMRNDPLACLK